MLQNRHRFLTCQWRHVIGSFFGIVLSFTVVLSIPGCHRKSTPEVIYIGHLASFQGPDKLSAEHARQGIQLALEEAESEDGTINNRRVEVIHVDIGGDPKSVEPATVRLVVVNKVAALLGGKDWGQSSAMAGIAHNYEVPMVTSAGFSKEQLNEYVFCTGLSPETIARVLAEFASQHHTPALRRIAILTDGINRGPASLLAGKFAQAFLQTKDISLAGEWTYKVYRKGPGAADGDWGFKDSEDLKEIMEQLRKGKPDAIFLAGAVSDLPRLRKAGIQGTIPILIASGGDTAPAPELAESDQPVFFVSPFALTDDENQKDFVKRYESTFHELPDAAAALAYDNTRILIDGLKRTSSFKGPAIKKAIEESMDFQTLTGRISFDKQDHCPDRPAYVCRIQDGRTNIVYTSPVPKKNPEPLP
jgi:branched-chain amino acid transport system substrate-binding protein